MKLVWWFLRMHGKLPFYCLRWLLMRPLFGVVRTACAAVLLSTCR
jgi:hypothetical protein